MSGTNEQRVAVYSGMTGGLPGRVGLLGLLVGLQLGWDCSQHDPPPPDAGPYGSVELRWTLNGSGDSLSALCPRYGADRVFVTSMEEGYRGNERCDAGRLQVQHPTGTARLHAILVDRAEAELAPPWDVTVQVSDGNTAHAEVDFQIPSSCRATGTSHNNSTIDTDETWLASDGPHHVPGPGVVTVKNGAVLAIQAGSTVCFRGGTGLRFTGGARLRAGDYPAATVIFTGDYVSPSQPHARWAQIQLLEPLTPPLRSTITNAVIEDAEQGILAGQSHPLTIDHTTIRTNTTPALVLFAADSQVIASTIDATGSSGLDSRAVVEIPSNGVTFKSRVKSAPSQAVLILGFNVTLDDCEIIASAGDGVRLLGSASNVRVTGCNLETNNGLAINNTSASPVIADDNWWDPPGGGNPPTRNPPNGISTNVTVSRVRNSRRTLGY